MPEHVKVLLDEWDALREKHEQALLADDIEAARKYGDEISAFMELHCETLNIPDKQMEGMRQSQKESEVHWEKYKIAEATLKKARFVYREAKQSYEQTLLKMPPKDKHRTSH